VLDGGKDGGDSRGEETESASYDHFSQEMDASQDFEEDDGSKADQSNANRLGFDPDDLLREALDAEEPSGRGGAIARVTVFQALLGCIASCFGAARSSESEEAEKTPPLSARTRSTQLKNWMETEGGLVPTVRTTSAAGSLQARKTRLTG
jgi:hypothetical protein